MIINGQKYQEVTRHIKWRHLINRDINRIVVHGGRFHADDVFCAAMLLMIYPDAEVMRVTEVTDELSLNDKTIVADIGYGKYDHHQPDAEVRETGNRYSACGLVFRDFKHVLFNNDADAAARFERKYIIPVEIDDNGGEGNPLSSIIYAFNPPWDTGENSDEQFAKAVSFVQSMIDRELELMESEQKAAAIVSEAFRGSDGLVVVLPRDLPWRETLIKTTALYAVYPSVRGGYNIQTVPEREGSKKPKKRLPEEWIYNKPEGCSFVHPDLFIASFETGTDALEAARQAANESQAMRFCGRDGC